MRPSRSPPDTHLPQGLLMCLRPHSSLPAQVGMRLNRSPPNITFRKKKTGGITINSMVQLTRMDERMVQRILQVRRRAKQGTGTRAGGRCICACRCYGSCHAWCGCCMLPQGCTAGGGQQGSTCAPLALNMFNRSARSTTAQCSAFAQMHVAFPCLAGVQDPQLRPAVQGGLLRGRPD